MPTIPVIIDADGLNIISTRPEILSSLPPKTVLTPHPGEFFQTVWNSNHRSPSAASPGGA